MVLGYDLMDMDCPDLDVETLTEAYSTGNDRLQPRLFNHGGPVLFIGT
jgi:hypothetical protein